MLVGQFAARMTSFALPVLTFFAALLAPNKTLPVFTAVATALLISITCSSPGETLTCTDLQDPCRLVLTAPRLRFLSHPLTDHFDR